MQFLHPSFEDLTDPRVERTREHELFDLVVVALLGTIAGADTWADIERFGKARLTWLRTFLPLTNGIPSHDTFGRVFALLDPAQLSACIRQWLDQIGVELGKHIAIDGKTLCGSFDKAARKNPLHLVSAWACEARVTLGQIAVDAKSNEITAIPLLLELLELKGATVTIDAMGCQKEIAAKIIDRGGEYLLALKGNHEKLHASVMHAFETALAADERPKELKRCVSAETNRGREERREVFTLPAERLGGERTAWKNLTTLVLVLRTTRAGDTETSEASYYVSSLSPQVKAIAAAIRRHWSIESRLHWVLDVTFTEDASRIRKRHAPQTSAILRRTAVSILSRDTSIKDNLRGKRYRACLSTDALEGILRSFAGNEDAIAVGLCRSADNQFVLRTSISVRCPHATRVLQGFARADEEVFMRIARKRLRNRSLAWLLAPPHRAAALGRGILSPAAPDYCGRQLYCPLKGKGDRMKSFDLAHLSKTSGIELRKLRYCVDHELVPPHMVRLAEEEIGQPRQFEEPTAVLLVGAAMLLRAGVRRDGIKWAIEKVVRVQKAKPNPLRMPLFDFAVQARHEAVLMAADSTHIRVSTQKEDSGWISVTGKFIREPFYQPSAWFSVDLARIREMIQHG